MTKILDRVFLEELKKLGKHDTGKVLDVLPFLTKRTKAIRGEFNKVLGEYVRNITGFQFNKKSTKESDFYYTSEGNELAELVANEVEFTEEDDKYDFIRFLTQYLFNQEELRPIHPYLFNYMKLDDKNMNEFKKYADFMSQVLVRENKEIKSVFNNKESDDIMTELILTKMSELHNDDDVNREKSKYKNEYQPLLDSLCNLYQEDLLFLSKHKDYFLTTFPILTHFYTFMYACQLIIKFEQFEEADVDSTRALYFTLEWESMSKHRKAASELEGFKYIKEKSINLFPHIHTISHLSHSPFNNDLKDTSKRLRFIPYSKLYQLIKNEGQEFEQDFIEDLKQWIVEYSDWRNINDVEMPADLKNGFRVLFRCLKEGTSTDVAKKFGEKIEFLGAPFIKNRGGHVLNIKHDFLLLLTAVSVKDKRIPLKELFVEFEKRGVAFDRYSKKEIVTLFDNHNILDKKSDSGDAQYVKPIL